MMNMSSLPLPDGWRREEIKKTNGISCKTDVMYISPDGKRIRSKPELARYLGNAIDLSSFDYRAGRINPALLRKSRRTNNTMPVGGVPYDYRALKNDPSMVNPVRQTTGFIKQPVTVVKTQPDSRILNAQQIREYRKKYNLNFTEPKSDNTVERCFQFFWPRRLEGQRATDPRSQERLDDFQLPANIRAFQVTLANNDDLFRSITAALYFDNRAVRGQEKKTLNRIKREMDEDLCNMLAFINPHQPLAYSITVTEDDISYQEEVVRRARQKLKEALKEQSSSSSS